MPSTLVVSKKRKHCPCKPGSVPPRGRRLPFIYADGYPTAPAFYPPSEPEVSGGQPSPTVYANLQPPDGTARRSPAAWWALTPPSHPCPMTRRPFRRQQKPRREAVILFSRILLSPIAGTFTSGVSCAARTFLSCLCDTSGRPWHCFPRAKIQRKGQTSKFSHR